MKKQLPLVHRVLMGALMAGSLCLPAHADNQMGYRLLSDQEAQSLPQNHGALGMAIEAAQRITDGGMTFDLIRVKQVRSGSPGEQAGFHPGDEIIAVNGEVFSSLATFAQYVGSAQPGSQINVDYIPAGGGPQQAQRIAVTVGMAGQAAQAAPQADQSNQPQTGLSTGTKVAIGMGAVALFGCYELGCFSHHHHAAVPQSGQAPAVCRYRLARLRTDPACVREAAAHGTRTPLIVTAYWHLIRKRKSHVFHDPEPRSETAPVRAGLTAGSAASASRCAP